MGDHSIASQLGKKGTATDIAIYDRKTPDSVFTWTAPIGFPDKIQSLLQAVNIAEYAVLNVTALDKFLGEQILALDYGGISAGFILHSYGVDREKLVNMLKTTILSGYRILDSVDALKAEMANLEPKPNEGPVVIPIDHAFDVKGVGTVVLGVVRQGTVKVYDELVLVPSNKSVLVKSIQMHDDPVQSSSSPSRVGLAIKGVTAEEISRGDMICAPDAVKTANERITIRFKKSPFFKGDVLESQMYMMSIGMQIRPVRIKIDGDLFQVSFDKPIGYYAGQSCVLLKPDNPGTRIIGKGEVQ